MAFVRVKLIVNGKTYSVEVDEDARAQVLIQGFVDQLKLPKDTGYSLHLVNALHIQDGVTLKLVPTRPEDQFRNLQEEPASKANG